MGARLTAALLVGRAATSLSRRLGRGGGTVISGHLVPRIAPDALSTITSRLEQGSILVSGTNGKTTTARLLAHLLRSNGFRPIHNRAGANLLTGLTSAVIAQSDLDGQPRGNIGLFEVDEATLPTATRSIRPRLVLLTNIFRDQLDRYGEVDFVFRTWRQATTMLPTATRLVLNADDPLVAALGEGRESAVYFGLEDTSLAIERPPHAADARLCVRCGARYAVDVSFYGHLGHYRCSSCGFARPRPTVALQRCRFAASGDAEIEISTPDGSLEAQLRLPGLYSVYNALAASAAAWTLGLSPRAIGRNLASFTAAFGRLERIPVEQRTLFLALVKNPVGFTEVLRTVVPIGGGACLAIFINDHFADGTDVSWLWDVDFELLAGRTSWVVCSGTRAEDLAVRLKYAGLPPEQLVLESDPRRALELALERSDPGETVYVLPTYTAMLEVRELLRRTGYVDHFYED
jgi:UDP-N-acetylmuramyl tripeptide synthase